MSSARNYWLALAADMRRRPVHYAQEYGRKQLAGIEWLAGGSSDYVCSRLDIGEHKFDDGRCHYYYKNAILYRKRDARALFWQTLPKDFRQAFYEIKRKWHTYQARKYLYEDQKPPGGMTGPAPEPIPPNTDVLPTVS